MVIEGKYCQISVGLSDLNKFGGARELENGITAVDTIKDKLNLYERFRKNLNFLDETNSEKNLR